MSKCRMLFFAVIFIQSCKFSDKDNEQIRKCFNDYKNAILNKQGKLGLNCVNLATINYYSLTLRKVIEFDSIKIENEPSIDKYTILKIRQNISYDSILHLDGKSLLVCLINYGFAGNSNISLYEIGNIHIDHDTATVQKIIKGKATQLFFKFYKENNLWKLSSFSPRDHELYNWGIKQAISKSKLSEDDYILNYIKTSSGVNLKKDIWHPLVK